MANKQYTVQGPNGQKISFWGPEGASDQQLIQHAQSMTEKGRVRPTNKPAPKAAAAPKAPTGTTGRSTMDTISDTAGKFFDSATMGLGDEFMGAAGVVGNTLGAVAGGIATGNAKAGWDAWRPGEVYQADRAKFKKDQERFSNDHGVLSGVATGAGIVSTIPLGMGLARGARLGGLALQSGNAGRVATTAGKALNAVGRFGRINRTGGTGARIAGMAKAGLIPGAVGGFANGEGLQGRAAGAAAGGAMGYGLGGVLGVTGAGLKAGGRYVMEHSTGANRIKAGVNDAYDQLGDWLEQSRLNPTTAYNEIARRTNDLGVPTFLGDLADPLRSGLAKVASGFGPARAAVKEAVDARAKGSTSRIAAFGERDLGASVQPKAHLEALTKARNDAADAEYAKVFAETPEMSKAAVQSLHFNPDLQEALDIGARNVRMADMRHIPGVQKTHVMGKKWHPEEPAIPPRSEPSKFLDASGRPIMREIPGTPAVPAGMRDSLVPNFQTISAANAHTGRVGAYGKTFQATPGEQGAVNGARAQGHELRELFSTPAWDASRKVYKDGSDLMEAFESGAQHVDSTADEIRAATKGMNPQQLEQWTLNHATALKDKVRNADFYGDTTKKLLGNLQKNDALGQVYGSKAGSNLGRYVDSLDAERSAHLTYKRLYGVPGEMNRGGDSAGGKIAQAGMLGAMGAPSAAGSRLIAFADKYLTTARSNASKAKLAEALASGDLASVQAILKATGMRSQAVKVAMAKANRLASTLGRTTGRVAGLSQREAPEEQ